MSRLLIHVEGQTEETFVNELLAPHLHNFGYTTIGARLIGNARHRGHRGGIRPWPAVRQDILNHLRQDPGSRSTTMVDFYALPKTGDGAWPGRAEAGVCGDVASKASAVTSALLADIRNYLEDHFRPAERFLPFVMMHEFEGLLFSDPAGFARAIEGPDLSDALQRIRCEFETPEDINDSVITAPSKRILALYPGYQKPLMGTLAALEIGLDAIRRQCPIFNAWLQRLETWL